MVYPRCQKCGKEMYVDVGDDVKDKAKKANVYFTCSECLEIEHKNKSKKGK